MASAVLASGNESSWAQSGGGFMGKLPSYLNPNPNPNPNPKKKQKQFHQQTANGNGGRHNNKDDSSPAFTQTASDDAYSFVHKPEINRNGFNSGGYLTYSVSSYSKSDIVELRKRLSSELEQIRNLRDRIESGQFSGGNKSQGKTKKLSGNKRPHIPFRSADKDPKRFSGGYDNGGRVGNVVCPMDEAMSKECRQILTKLMKHKNGWIFNTPVDAESFGLHDYHQIVKRPMDLGTVKSNLAKNLYPTAAEFAADVRLTFNNALLYNPKTDQVNGWAEMLLAKFEDLFRPIQQSIDNEKREYFGGGGGSSVGGGLAEELHGSSWNHIPTPERPKKPKVSPIQKKHERVQAHSSASTPSNPPPPAVAPPKAQSPEPTPSPKSPPVKPQASQSQQMAAAKASVPKQPKPRAKDPNKREMSMEEKHKLGVGLQSLPQEKMPQLVQIIRKRNEHLAQDGDEIELDIEALDTETLWELDRFVTNWKKMVSKTKRQALMMNNYSNTTAVPNTSIAEADMGARSERNDAAGKKPRKGEVGGDEDVDIDDDMPDTNFPPVEIEKDDVDDDMPDTNFPPVEIEKDEVVAPQDNGNAASSSSSSSGSSSGDSSSSSGNDSCLTTLRSGNLLDEKQNCLNAYASEVSGTDSDSGSSSGSESDADEAQS